MAGPLLRRSATVPMRVARLRAGIDGLDDLLLLTLAARRRLVAATAAAKRNAGIDAADARREAAVLARGTRLARRLGLPHALAVATLRLAIADARAQQGLAPIARDACGHPVDEAGETGSEEIMAKDDTIVDVRIPSPVLRAFPPPRRWAPLVRVLPAAWSARLLQAALPRVLARPLADGDLDFLAGRTIAIDVADLGVRWVLSLVDGRLHVDAGGGAAEATVRAGVTDLLALASRRADADTLFFQRRLAMTGDTELGLTARNLLDRLPWADVPLAARIVLDRAARFAVAARAAHGAGARGGDPLLHAAAHGKRCVAASSGNDEASLD